MIGNFVTWMAEENVRCCCAERTTNEKLLEEIDGAATSERGTAGAAGAKAMAIVLRPSAGA